MEFIVVKCAQTKCNLFYEGSRKLGRYESSEPYDEGDARANVTHAPVDPGPLAARGRVRQFRGRLRGEAILAGVEGQSALDIAMVKRRAALGYRGLS